MSPVGNVIEHTDGVFSIPGFLSPSECSDLIALAEREGFSVADVRTAAGNQSLPRVRNNERVVFESPPWIDLLWQRLGSIALPELQGERAQGLPKALRFYKYSPGQRFKMHKDGPWVEGGLTSKLTLLVYLNEEFSGGDTDFRAFRIIPKTGSALVFVHDTWHEGAILTEGVKYVLRSDVLYGSPNLDIS